MMWNILGYNRDVQTWKLITPFVVAPHPLNKDDQAIEYIYRMKLRETNGSLGPADQSDYK